MLGIKVGLAASISLFFFGLRAFALVKQIVWLVLVHFRVLSRLAWVLIQFTLIVLLENLFRFQKCRCHLTRMLTGYLAVIVLLKQQLTIEIRNGVLFCELEISRFVVINNHQRVGWGNLAPDDFMVSLSELLGLLKIRGPLTSQASPYAYACRAAKN